MRKTTLLSVLFLFGLVLQVNSQILNQAANWPNASWVLSGTYDAASLISDPTVSANFSYDDDNAGSGSTDILYAESPVIDLTAAAGGGETWINVDYDYDYNLGTTFDLEYYDFDAASWVTWEALPDNSSLTSGWCAGITTPIVTSITLDISGFTATQLSGFQYRFSYNASSTWGWGFCVSSPTVYSSMPPSCLDPSALTATGITSSTADVSWTENGTATSWNIEYGTTGFVLGTGTQIMGTSNNPETITGLTPQTTYEFYVQADCGGSGTSNWVGPFSFTTLCAPEIAPWTETFTTTVTPTCWSQSATTGGPWTFTGNPGYDVAGTLDHTSGSTNNYAWIDHSGSDVGVILTSPIIDVSALSVPELRFWIVSHYSGSLGAYNPTYVEAWDGAAWQPVATVVGETGAAWVEYNFILSPWIYGGNFVQVRFRAESGGDGSDFYNDILLDDVSVVEAPTCPQPMNLTLDASDLTSATLSWTETGSATEWVLEYGAPGFTPGTGTYMVTTNNPETISGLTSNSFYEVYVRASCTPGDTSFYTGPVSFNTFNQGLYMDWDTDCGPGFTDISTTGTATGLTDDQELDLTLPFSLLYQGTLITDITIADNGAVLLGAPGTSLTFSNSVIGSAPAFGVYAFWDDIESQYGDIYYQTIGTSPNQQFIIQWQDQSYWPGPSAAEVITYQIIIDEATGEIYSLYYDTEFGGSDALYDNGYSATIGVNGPNQDIQVSYNNTTFLENNSCIHYYYTDCPHPVNYSVTYTTNDEAGITWSAGLAGETDWTVIYGVEGFDPLTQGTTITTTTPAAILSGLNDITTYDVYIYADCNPGTLQSTGYMGQFTTLPNCSDVTGVNTTTAVDSVFTAWSWTESSGAGLYPSTGFNLQYGNMGFNLYSGTTVNADNNYTDTTFDASFMSGGVYEIYVQAVCNTDTSNWVGPFTFVMPLENDSTCLAETLNVDGTVYVFNNTGATTQTNEINVAPPATGCMTNDGWCNSNINFTTWFTFTAPASGNMLISGSDVGFDGQVAVYEVNDCANFNTYTLVGANDDNINTGAGAPEFSLCGLTPGNTYYLMHDSYSTVTTGNYSLRLSEIVVEAGTSAGILNICTGDTVNLFDGISGNDMGGSWAEEIATANFNDPYFPSAGLAYQVFNFEYTVVDGCATDSVIQQVQIYGPSSAGNDGTVTVCQNEPFDLLEGLSGNVDLGGTWYDPSNTALASSSVVASSIPGQFNYDYITSNGVCPSDTSNVVVNVDPGCDYLDIQELYFSEVTLYPNPATDMVYVANSGSAEIFSYEVTDIQGKVIARKANAINGTEITEIDVNGLEIGVYLVRVYNDNAEKTFRVVKQ